MATARAVTKMRCVRDRMATRCALSLQRTVSPGRGRGRSYTNSPDCRISNELRPPQFHRVDFQCVPLAERAASSVVRSLRERFLHTKTGFTDIPMRVITREATARGASGPHWRPAATRRWGWRHWPPIETTVAVATRSDRDTRSGFVYQEMRSVGRHCARRRFWLTGPFKIDNRYRAHQFFGSSLFSARHENLDFPEETGPELVCSKAYTLH
jgi:hypothetical protein